MAIGVPRRANPTIQALFLIQRSGPEPRRMTRVVPCGGQVKRGKSLLECIPATTPCGEVPLPEPLRAGATLLY